MPTAEIVEVATTRPTPSDAAASTAMRGLRAFIAHTRSAGLEATYPAVWKSTSEPRTALHMSSKSSTSAFERLKVTPGRRASLSGSR